MAQSHARVGGSLDETRPGYLRTAADYVHLNPARAGLMAEYEKLASYPWSSFPGYLITAGTRPARLRVDRDGIAQDDRRGRREFERRLESQRQTNLAADGELMRNGWRLGAENFVDRLLGKWEEKWANITAAGSARRLRQKARRLIASEKALRWQERASQKSAASQATATFLGKPEYSALRRRLLLLRK